jgi:O-antigen ligase
MSQASRGSLEALRVTAILAVVVPSALAYNVPPSATFLNQAAALVGWGVFLFLMVLAGWSNPRPRLNAGTGANSLLAAFGLMLAGVLASALLAGLPGPLALSSAGLLVAAALVICVAVAGARTEIGAHAFRAFCEALVWAGVVSAGIALVQTFMPGWTDGTWIANVSSPGRVGANLRQPNHLASLLVLSAIALVWTRERASDAPGSASVVRWASGLLLPLFIFGIVLTASRTGAICVALLAVWAAVDRRMSRTTRLLLWAAPVVFVLGWVGMDAWARAGAHAFSGDSQLHRSDLSSSRFAIWGNTLSMIAAQPWTGVGWGEFNLAWTLSVFPGRPTAFFDHTHNLPLQLLVELGLPLGLLILGLLLCALWCACRAAVRAPAGPDGTRMRAATMMVLTMAVHSQLEYPLWYAYFLLPTAFAFGMALSRDAAASDPPHGRRSLPPLMLAVACCGLAAGGIAAVVDYARVVAIFSPPAGAASLQDRIADGQRSWFFAHHADYAAVTTIEHPSEAMPSFRSAPHYLLDARLLIAWARALDEAGDVQRARYVAQRLREFHNDQAEAFFAPCDDAAVKDKPFQCLAPTSALGYRDFR